jgi:hypothetical protein
VPTISKESKVIASLIKFLTDFFGEPYDEKSEPVVKPPMSEWDIRFTDGRRTTIKADMFEYDDTSVMFRDDNEEGIMYIKIDLVRSIRKLEECNEDKEEQTW